MALQLRGKKTEFDLKARFEAAKERVAQADQAAAWALQLTDAMRLYGVSEAALRAMREEVEGKTTQDMRLFRQLLRRTIKTFSKEAASNAVPPDRLDRLLSSATRDTGYYRAAMAEAGVRLRELYLVTLHELVEATGYRGGDPQALQDQARKELDRARRDALARCGELREQITNFQAELADWIALMGG